MTIFILFNRIQEKEETSIKKRKRRNIVRWAAPIGACSGSAVGGPVLNARAKQRIAPPFVLFPISFASSFPSPVSHRRSDISRATCPPRRRSLIIMASNDGEGGEGWEAAVRAEMGGASWWDDPDGADLHARFKAFTGQRRDWPEPKLLFWKDLLLRVARRLRLCSAPAHLVSQLRGFVCFLF